MIVGGVCDRDTLPMQRAQFTKQQTSAKQGRTLPRRAPLYIAYALDEKADVGLAEFGKWGEDVPSLRAAIRGLTLWSVDPGGRDS